MIAIHEISHLPGQVEAALQFLRHSEEIQQPSRFSGGTAQGRNLTKTEFEVKDSALVVLLEYFNQPLPPAGMPGNAPPSAGTSDTPFSH